jgi:hypothetical protein
VYKISPRWVDVVIFTSFYLEPPLWTSGQSQIQRSGFDSRRYHIWEVVVLERGPFSLVSTTEEILGRNSNGSALENREYGRGDPLRWPRDNLYPQKLILTSPTSGGRPMGTVRSPARATEFALVWFSLVYLELCVWPHVISRWIQQRNGIKFVQISKKCGGDPGSD